MASATSGMRATSALTNTMAVITSRTLSRRLVHRRELAALGERHQREPGLVDGVVHGEVPGRPRDRAGPLPFDVDETDAGGLQPAQHLLGLLGGGGGHRAGAGADGLR